jgi:hypothetical protein
LGLNITVGTLAARREGDDDDTDYLVEQLELVNEALTDNGLPEFREPTNVASDKRCDFDMGPYSWLHHLRRLAAHLALRGELPEPGDETAAEDPVLERYFVLAKRHNTPEPGFLPRSTAGAKAAMETEPKLTFDHLILHSDAEGYYVPIPFPKVIYPSKDDIAGAMVGSSQALLEELRRVARALEIPADLGPESKALFAAVDNQGKGEKTWQRFAIESFTCVRLMRAAEASIATKSAIVFG